MEQKPPSKNKRRLLIGGAGLGGPLVGLLLLTTVFAGGNEVTVGVAPAAVPKQAQTTTTLPVPMPAQDEAALLAAASDPFRQLVTVPDATQSTDATPIPGGPAEQPAVDDVLDLSAVGGAPVNDEPSGFAGSESSLPATDEGAGVPPPTVTGETVNEAAAPAGTSISPPTTELPVPTTTISSPSTLPPTTTTVPPPTTTTSPPTTTTTTTTPAPTTTVTTITTSTTSTTVAPPGRAIVFAGVRDGNQDIYTIDPAGGAPRQLTAHRAADRDPAWSPDGKKIAFVSERTSRPEMFVMGADGSAQAQVTAIGGSPARPSWGRDGESLVFESTEAATGNRELFMLTLRTGVTRRLTSGSCAGTPVRVCPNGNISHGQPVSSPDGTRIAFVRSDRTGRHLLVMNADGSDIRSLGGTGAANPAWSADGQKLAYDDIDGIRVVSAGGGLHEVVAYTSAACPPAPRCPVFFEPSWSPDSTRLTVRDGKPGTTTGDLYVIDLHGPLQTRLTGEGQVSGPQWFSPAPAAATP